MAEMQAAAIRNKGDIQGSESVLQASNDNGDLQKLIKENPGCLPQCIMPSTIEEGFEASS